MNHEGKGCFTSDILHALGLELHEALELTVILRLGLSSRQKRETRKLLHLKSIDLHPLFTTVFTMVGPSLI